MIQQLYNFITEKIKNGRGIRQGNKISPKLFITILEYVFKKLEWNSKGISLDEEKSSHFRYTDDIGKSYRSKINVRTTITHSTKKRIEK